MKPISNVFFSTSKVRLADPLSQSIPEARKGLCFGRVYYPLNLTKQPSNNVAYNTILGKTFFNEVWVELTCRVGIVCRIIQDVGVLVQCGWLLYTT
jgi:hypothetical protein